MKDHYFFATFFTKYSKIFAFTLLLVGLTLNAFILLSWKAKTQKITYRNNPLLTDNLSLLLKDYGRTKNEVLQLHSKMMPSNEVEIKLNKDPQIYESYTKMEHFSDLRSQLKKVKNNIKIFKGLVIQHFSESADILLNKMRHHADNKQWIDPKAKKEGEETETLESFNLITSKAASFKKSVESLRGAKTYLRKLKKEAENPESIENIDKMVNCLNQYELLMGKIDTDPENSKNELSDNRKRVFLVIDEVELIKKEVQEIAESDWTLDIIYKKVAGITENESQKCMAAEVFLSKMNFSNTLLLAVVLLVSLALTFGSLVFSDLCSAVLRSVDKK